MNKLLPLLLAVSLGLNVGLALDELADRHARRGSRDPGPSDVGRPEPPSDPEVVIADHVAGVTGHLGLDAAQQDALRDVLRGHMPGFLAQRRRVDGLNRRLSAAFAAPALDPAAFAALVDSAGIARSRLDSLSGAMLLGEASVLTSEQRIRFARVAPTVHIDPGPRPRSDRRPPADGGRRPTPGR